MHLEGYESGVNPYIPLADLLMNLVLVFALVLYLAPIGQQVRYASAQERIRGAVEDALLPELRPDLLPSQVKHDPPGTQRWVFPSRQVFKPGTTRFTPEGRRALLGFARAVAPFQPGPESAPNPWQLWDRIRLEGHTAPSRAGEPERWERSVAMAVQVAAAFHRAGLPNYVLAVAGRGGQDQVPAEGLAGERVEIVVEFSSPRQGEGALPRAGQQRPQLR